MNTEFRDFLRHCQQRTEKTLKHLCEPTPGDEDVLADNTLAQAMRYSLLNGGKRVRATLVYASAEAIGNSTSAASLDAVAASIESLHCYSLVHDDLPAMDDDDLRRGLPSCHKAYDEATAILAGDALQSLSFELLADSPGLSPQQRITLVKILASAAGVQGMAGGQFVDLSIEQRQPNIELLETMHQMKTGALIRAALSMGGVAASAGSGALQSLDRFGHLLGLAFQVKDDLLDIEASTGTLGKRQGSDIANNKMTYPALLGLTESKKRLDSLRQQALATLQPFGSNARQLANLTQYIVDRDH